MLTATTAQIHGYDYKFIRTYKPEERIPHWLKVNAMLDVLSDYDFVIFIDTDAQFQHPEIPVEWLLNRWNITHQTALALAREPDRAYNLDANGRLNDNTGFMIAQNIPRTHEMLKAWISCPDEPIEEFKGCAHWKTTFLGEQGAFSEYLRVRYNEPDDVIELPCDESNGYPGADGECHGRLVRHVWTAKDSTKGIINDSFMQVLMWQLHKQFMTDPSSMMQLQA